jgi:hypothetical protein
MRFLILLPLLFSTPWLSGRAQTAQQIAPNELVRQVVAHELQADAGDHSHWMYQVVTRVPPPEKSTTVVEANNGDLTVLNAIDGRPLTPDQRSAEQRRIQRFIADPNLQDKARRAAAADDKKTEQLFGMLPDAFLYTYKEWTGDTVKLEFHPNPAFSAHSSDAYVFHKMDGYLVVNTKEQRLVEIAGRLSNGVQFAGGLLGHLDPGGTFDVHREAVAPGHWVVTRLQVNMNGKVLFFKTIAVQQDEIHCHFRRIPDETTLAQAEKLAREESAKIPGQ